MLRPLLALCVIALGAVPAAASNYSATLRAPTSDRFITSDIVWNCGPGACQGATEESRPVVLCQSLARRAGVVVGFLVDGRALNQAELASCNAAAKAERTKALAAQ